MKVSYLLDASPDNQESLAGIIPAGVVAAEAREILSEYRSHRDAVVANTVTGVTRGMPFSENPAYWLGLLQGTIESLLAVVPGGDGR